MEGSFLNIDQMLVDLTEMDEKIETLTRMVGTLLTSQRRNHERLHEKIDLYKKEEHKKLDCILYSLAKFEAILLTEAEKSAQELVSEPEDQATE